MSDVASATASASTLPLVRWRMTDFDVGAGARAQAHSADPAGEAWIDVPAPGDAYIALHEAGRIPHPFDDRAEAACAWVSEREWWWRTAFDAPPLAANQRLILDFEGLDTFAEVWLNGEKLAASDNMFVPLRIDVTGRVKPGANQLAVGFTPTAAALADIEPPLWPRSGATLVSSKRAGRCARRSSAGAGTGVRPCPPSASGSR